MLPTGSVAEAGEVVEGAFARKTAEVQGYGAEKVGAES